MKKTKRRNPKISIIVPVYNASSKLPILIDSLLKQTYENFEVILIDDGSSDDSFAVCQNYAKADSRVLAYTRENKGISYTRNEGIGLAKGEYLTFCDNDDEVEDNYLEDFVNCLSEDDYDIIIGGCKRMTYEGKIIYEKKLSSKPLAKYAKITCWGNLYKTSFVKEKKLEFLKTAIGEDVYFNLLAYEQTTKIRIIEETKYHWLFNDESVSNTKDKNLKHVDELLETFNMINNKLKGNYKDLEALEYFYLRTIIYYLFFACKGVKKEKINESYTKMFVWYDSFKTFKKNRYVGALKNNGEEFSVKWIISIFLFLRKIHLAKPLLYIYSKI